jgi:hypothetical protein
MSDFRDPLLIQRALPVSRPAPVQPIRREFPTNASAHLAQAAFKPSTVVATTDGGLRPAYAQFVTDPDTHDTVLRIRDANTNAVISESPTPEIQAMSRALKAYADTVARHRAALHRSPAS